MQLYQFEEQNHVDRSTDQGAGVEAEIQEKYADVSKGQVYGSATRQNRRESLQRAIETHSQCRREYCDRQDVDAACHCEREKGRADKAIHGDLAVAFHESCLPGRSESTQAPGRE